MGPRDGQAEPQHVSITMTSLYIYTLLQFNCDVDSSGTTSATGEVHRTKGGSAYFSGGPAQRSFLTAACSCCLKHTRGVFVAARPDVPVLYA